MNCKNKCLFSCIGRKTKPANDTDFIDLNRSQQIRSHDPRDETLYVNDVVASKPELTATPPKYHHCDPSKSQEDGKGAGGFSKENVVNDRHGTFVTTDIDKILAYHRMEHPLYFTGVPEDFNSHASPGDFTPDSPNISSDSKTSSSTVRSMMSRSTNTLDEGKEPCARQENETYAPSYKMDTTMKGSVTRVSNGLSVMKKSSSYVSSSNFPDVDAGSTRKIGTLSHLRGIMYGRVQGRESTESKIREVLNEDYINIKRDDRSLGINPHKVEKKSGISNGGMETPTSINVGKDGSKMRFNGVRDRQVNREFVGSPMIITLSGISNMMDTGKGGSCEQGEGDDDEDFARVLHLRYIENSVKGSFSGSGKVMENVNRSECESEDIDDLHHVSVSGVEGVEKQSSMSNSPYVIDNFKTINSVGSSSKIPREYYLSESGSVDSTHGGSFDDALAYYIEDEIDEGVDDQLWKMFISASRKWRGLGYCGTGPTWDKGSDQGDCAKKRYNIKNPSVQNEQLTLSHQDALDIVENTIRRLNNC